MQVNASVLQRSPQPLDEDVVHEATAAVRADPHVGVPQHRREVEAGELTAPGLSPGQALIGVEDRWRPKAGIPSSSASMQKPASSVRQLPRQHLPARPIPGGDQVEKAPAHRDLGHVGAPDVIRPFDCEVSQQVGVGLVLRCGSLVLGFS